MANNKSVLNINSWIFALTLAFYKMSNLTIRLKHIYIYNHIVSSLNFCLFMFYSIYKIVGYTSVIIDIFFNFYKLHVYIKSLLITNITLKILVIHIQYIQYTTTPIWPLDITNLLNVNILSLWCFIPLKILKILAFYSIL